MPLLMRLVGPGAGGVGEKAERFLILNIGMGILLFIMRNISYRTVSGLVFSIPTVCRGCGGVRVLPSTVSFLGSPPKLLMNYILYVL